MLSKNAILAILYVVNVANFDFGKFQPLKLPINSLMTVFEVFSSQKLISRKMYVNHRKIS